MMHLQKKLEEWFASQAVLYKISSENAVALLLPMYLAVLLVLIALIFGFLGFAEMSLLIAWPLCMFLLGVEGVVVAVKKEVPGQPWMRGKFVAVLMGIAYATLFWGGLFVHLFVK